MINKTEIEKAQNSWGNGIITIGKLKDNPKECRIFTVNFICLLYTSPSPRDLSTSRMPSSA